MAAAPVLGERPEVRLVRSEDRDGQVELGGEHRREWDVAPSEVRGEVHEPVGPPRDPHDGNADADQDALGRQRVEERSGQLGHILDRLLRGEAAAGPATRTRLKTWPPSPTVATATESTASSTARTAARWDRTWTTGERASPVPSGAPGRSSTSPMAESSPSRSAIVERLRPVVLVSSERDSGPARWRRSSTAPRLWRRISSAATPPLRTGGVAHADIDLRGGFRWNVRGNHLLPSWEGSACRDIRE